MRSPICILSTASGFGPRRRESSATWSSSRTASETCSSLGSHRFGSDKTPMFSELTRRFDSNPLSGGEFGKGRGPSDMVCGEVVASNPAAALPERTLLSGALLVGGSWYGFNFHNYFFLAFALPRLFRC